MHIIYNGPDTGVYDLFKFREFMDSIKAESVYSQGESRESYHIRRRIEIFHCSNITIRYHAWCELQTFPVMKFPDFYSVEVNLHGKDEYVKNLEEKLKDENRKILSVKHA